MAIWGSTPMPCIWGQHNNSQLFCSVVIIPGSAQLPIVTSVANVPVPTLPSTTAFAALIDTGATTTGISNKVVTQLNLQPVGRVPIHSVSGIQHHNSYLIRVGFPFLLPPGSALAVGLPPLAPGQAHTQLHLLDKVIQSCEFHAGNANFDVILGMDVLSTGSLVVQGGNGTYSFSF